MSQLDLNIDRISRMYEVLSSNVATDIKNAVLGRAPKIVEVEVTDGTRTYNALVDSTVYLTIAVKTIARVLEHNPELVEKYGNSKE